MIVVAAWIDEVHLEVALNAVFFVQNERIRILVLSSGIFTAWGFAPSATVLGCHQGRRFVVNKGVARVLVAVHLALVRALL